MSVDALARARQAMDAQTSDAGSLTAFLDAVIGAPNRLLAQSPHASELLDSKRAFAAQALAAFHANIDAALRERLQQSGISAADAPGMLVAAAHGALKTGDLAEKPYRRRLDAIVEVMLAGLRAR